MSSTTCTTIITSLTSRTFHSLYTPLPPNSIRILHLAPGPYFSPIQCKLLNFNLSSLPHYSAISYCWGYSSETEYIHLDKQTIHIGDNLSYCLRRLRDENEEQLVWVDAVCINQADMEEKSEQIRLIPDIYRSAQQTYIWLGEDSKVQLRQYQRERLNLKPGQPLFLSSAFSLLEELAKGECFKESWLNAERAGMLYSITRLEWWNRVWVVQEMLLSTTAILVLGQRHIPWETVFQAAKYFIRHAAKCCNLESVEHGDLGGETKEDLLRTYLCIASSRILAYRPVSKGNKNELLSYLWMVRDRESTELNDKIYSILGLLSDPSSQAIATDYSVPFDTLCRTLTIDNIKTTDTLDFLKGTYTGTSKDPDRRFPSWVIDWSYPWFSLIDQRRILSEISAQMYHASGLRAAQVFFKPQNPYLLGLGGICVDKVAEAGPLGVDIIDERLRKTEATKILNSWLSLARKYQKALGEYPAGGSYITAFWRTTLCDIVLPDCSRFFPLSTTRDTSRRTKAADAIAWALWWLWCTKQIGVRGSIPAIRNIEASVRRVKEGRRFFVTKSGYMGLGPKDLRAGDEVVVLHGGDTPFLVREVGLDEEGRVNLEERGTHRLVGDCYVHGLMDGEVKGLNSSGKEARTFWLE